VSTVRSRDRPRARARRAAATCAALLAAIAGGCATPRGDPGAIADMEPGGEPAAATDEAGLWMVMEEAEERLATSGRRVTDAGLEAYLQRVVCRLTPEHCAHLRLYVVRVPHFNASMAPNGFMQIWTGLLLRAENEAQLAYVIGHEIGHYLRRHSLQQWRDVRAKTSALVLVQFATGAAGVGYVGDLAQLVALGSVYAFSRDQEREADEIGFGLMVDAGYDPREAARLWQRLEEERRAAKNRHPLVFFSTHPSSQERIDRLAARAGGALDPADPGEVGALTHLDAIRPFRAGWLRDELARRELDATEALIERLLNAGEAPGELHFFRGELYRLRAGEGDADRAVAAYRAAIAAPDTPAAAHRALGLMHWKAGRGQEAGTAFRRYLELAPDANDRAMIESYLSGLGASP